MKTIQIPGGEAVLRDSASELTPRQRRPIEIVSARIGRKVTQLATASRVLCDGDVIIDQSKVKDPTSGELRFTGGDVHVDERELALVMRLNDVLALALLKSWTIDHPLPTTEAEFGEIPIEVYDVLRSESARVNAAMSAAGDGFDVDAVEDPTSPIGD